MQVGPLTLDLPVLAALIGAGVVGFVLLVLLVALLRRRGERPAPPPVDLHIDVAELASEGPPPEGPHLEVYGVAVRLAALVLAPAGRNNPLPATGGLPQVIEDLLPGLMDVVAAHRPLIRRWPVQVSTQGFAHSFFRNAPLPGDRGKGTPWCSVAGRFESGQKQFLAGLICVAAKPNSLGQIIVPHLGKWMDVVRVKP